MPQLLDAVRTNTFAPLDKVTFERSVPFTYNLETVLPYGRTTRACSLAIPFGTAHSYADLATLITRC